MEDSRSRSTDSTCVDASLPQIQLVQQRPDEHSDERSEAHNDEHNDEHVVLARCGAAADANGATGDGGEGASSDVPDVHGMLSAESARAGAGRSTWDLILFWESLSERVHSHRWPWHRRAPVPDSDPHNTRRSSYVFRFNAHRHS